MIGLLGTFPSLVLVTSVAFNRKQKKSSDLVLNLRTTAICGIIVLSISTILVAANIQSSVLTIQPGENKGLHRILANSSTHDDVLLTKWNSFSRIDVINKTGLRQIASILIDADALTPILKWNGSSADLQWLKRGTWTICHMKSQK